MSEYPAFTPEQDLAFFGAAPLLKGEDPNQYNQLLETVSGTVKPADIFERAFVRTIVNLIFEANRYRRLIAETLVAAEQEALERVLRYLQNAKPQTLSRQYVLKRQAAIEEVDALLASAGLNWEVVNAEAFSLRLREIDSLNRMIAGAEARMKMTLREIDRHRKGFGRQLRSAIEQFADPATVPNHQREAMKQAA